MVNSVLKPWTQLLSGDLQSPLDSLGEEVSDEELSSSDSETEET